MILSKTDKKRVLFQDFRPLTQFEIEEKKPFLAKVGSLDYQVHLFGGLDFLRFFENANVINQGQDAIIEKIKESGSSRDLTNQFQSLLLARIKLLVDICEKPKGWLKAFRYKRKLVKYLFKHIDVAKDLFEKVVVYNNHVFFLLKRLTSLELIQTKSWTKTVSDEVSAPTNFEQEALSRLLAYNKSRKQNQSKNGTK